MANSDPSPTASPQSTTTHDKEAQSGGGAGGGGSGDGVQAATHTDDTPVVHPHSKPSSPSPDPQSQPTAPLSRPSLIQLGTSAAQSTAAASATHPKKFNAVNINKKFLEKNSSASGSAPISSASSSLKSGSPVARPQMQASASHSRLVTAKLTAAPSVTTSTAGWSRPSSVTPSPALPTSPIGTSPLPQPAIAATTPTAPQLPHAGKVIQPQPRPAGLQQTASLKDGLSSKAAAKPVWGNAKPPAAVPGARPDIAPGDFPTAAEVAKVTTSVRKQKQDEVKPSAPEITAAAAASKQARMEEADTFRGVHLDPNAHHWDEMEEDDDNFLGGVIEFGDGRQYKVESTDQPTPQSPSRGPVRPGDIPVPVSKEERFVDDFDRSWPRSRNSPSSSSHEVPPLSAGHGPSTSPSLPTHVLHSPQDSSRVLFNERSNRLEPYSHGRAPQFPGKRGNYQDSHSGVQLLQKQGDNEMPSRSRRFSGGREGGFGPGPFRDRQRGEREYPHRRDGPPPSPRITKDGFHAMAPSISLGGRDRDSNTDRGRRNVMGPPPLPAHAMRKASPDGGRQLPPHLSQVSPNMPVRRLPSRDSRLPEPPLSANVRHPSQSPALSHTSAAILSPATPAQPALPQMSAPELEEARKDLMQSAAARAKQRRQQEEEEREAQKERARKKAAELEEKMKAAETKQKEEEVSKRQKEEEEAAKVEQEAVQSQEREVVAIIEEAVKGVSLEPEGQLGQPSNPPLRRPPSLKDLPPSTAEPSRPGPPRRLSATAGRTASLTPTSATQTESWRVKASPLSAPPPLSAQRHGQPRTPVPAFQPPPPSPLEQVGAMTDNSADDLEIVDFSDMGKFVGAETPENTVDGAVEGKAADHKSSRPVASDFFEDKIPAFDSTIQAKSDSGLWRRRALLPETKERAEESPSTSASQTAKTTVIADVSAAVQEKPHAEHHPSASQPDVRQVLSGKEIAVDHHGGQTVTLPVHNGVLQRTPRNQSFYKEATMSALDDAMSRIKGALDASKETHPGATTSDAESVSTTSMPSQSVLKQQTPSSKWVPHATRSQDVDDSEEPREVFSVTASNPPASTKTHLVVKLPKTSRMSDPISRKQLQAFMRPAHQARFDILTFEPPVEGMNRRDFSLNEVLFRRQPGGYKGKPKYKVLLPRSKSYHFGPKVNIPSTAMTGKTTGAFGRPTVADGASTWRKPSSSPLEVDVAKMQTSERGLSTTSRSPPPEVSQSQITSLPKSMEVVSSNKVDTAPAPPRSRNVPKMPAGSSVAIYRDSRVDVVEADPKPSVNFIVTSELEDQPAQFNFYDASASNPDGESSGESARPAESKRVVNGMDTSPASTDRASESSIEHHLPSLTSTMADSKSSDDSILVTPPSHHTTPWSRASLLKESPARGPDPEHLKAVWSQPSNKAGLHPVNSLEGIADDLTALPFTLQDVKSEDGETPPPSVPTAPSRMSLHDVTRAFQQVPSTSSSSSPSHRAPLSPPSTNAPVARPAVYGYSPLPPANMRPTYAAYSSPMMSHSPAPMMYSHSMVSSPMPSRIPVNGHTSLYGSQPVWMPMGPNPPNSNSMMRPVASPYPGQLMHYPPGTPTMYAPPPPGSVSQSVTHPQNGVHASRGRGMPVMSPVMAHAGTPMYASSPALMHTQVMQVPQNYIPVPIGRGQPRLENGQMGLQGHAPLPNGHPPPHGGFNPPPASPYVRSTW